MKPRKPPALAVWLLERFGYLGENSALLGDLLEEFRTGRSASWFWRQTATVLVKGRSPKQVVLRLDLLGLLAGLLTQFPLSLLLWRFDIIPHVSGAGPIVLTSFAVLFGFVLAYFLTNQIAGRDVKELKLLILSTGGESRDRSALLRARSFDSFFTFLLCYCVEEAFPPHFHNLASLIVSQVVWLAIFLLPLFAGVWVKPAHATTAKPELPSHDLALPIALSDGRTIVLHPDSAAQDVFTVADEELARAVFKHGATLETLRRAVWFGSARRWLSLCKGEEPPPLTPQALAQFLRETAAKDRIEQAFYVGDLKLFWQRVSHHLRRLAA